MPKQVVIIRHGEKLGDPSSDEGDGGPNLSIRGSARAAALPSLFVPATPALDCAFTTDTMLNYFGASYNQIQSQDKPPRFATPDFLFATCPSPQSNRPVETIAPLSIARHIQINTQHPNEDYDAVAQDILSNPNYTGKNIVICWHHGKIPVLAMALGVPTSQLENLGLEKWPSPVFDRIWQIDYSTSPPTLTNQPQMLLYGDSDS